MTTTVVTTKPCTRCGGTGRYSFNLLDLDRCYGCGGTGLKAVAPKGQKAIKPTAELEKALPDDIIQVAKVLYRVVEIRWIRAEYRAHYYNQQVQVIRLVDDATLYIKREFHGINYDDIHVWTVNPDGSKTPCACFIETPESLIGQAYEPHQFAVKE